MSPVLTCLREFHFGSVLFRLLLALAAGAAMGYGRAKKRSTAGIRTYMLVSMGAALTMLIAMYEHEMLYGPWAWASEFTSVKFDASRFSAQVINGVGFLAAGSIIGIEHQQVFGMTSAIGLFCSAIMGIAAGSGFYEAVLIGAGTIVVTRKKSIRGLTTASGLWASGIIGLALGAGFYEGAVTAALLVVFTEVVFSQVGRRLRKVHDFRMAVHYSQRTALDRVLDLCKDAELAITSLQIMSAADDEDRVYTAVITLRRIGEDNNDALLSAIEADPEIFRAEILAEKPL